jgi:hypothetical protein
MNLGFTGTRHGARVDQMLALVRVIDRLRPAEFHHGCCVGADADVAHHARWGAGHAACRVVGHPSTLKGMTDQGAIDDSHEVREPKPPLARNRDIVNESDALIACPNESVEQLHSGTWATVRYARKQGKPVTLILPDGTVIEPA